MKFKIGDMVSASETIVYFREFNCLEIPKIFTILEVNTETNEYAIRAGGQFRQELLWLKEVELVSIEQVIYEYNKKKDELTKERNMLLEQARKMGVEPDRSVN